jgi:hypothetical protein
MGGRVVVGVIANKQSTLALLLPLPLPLVRVSLVNVSDTNFPHFKLSPRPRLTIIGPETCHFQPCIGHCTSQ